MEVGKRVEMKKIRKRRKKKIWLTKSFWSDKKESSAGQQGRERRTAGAGKRGREIVEMRRSKK